MSSVCAISSPRLEGRGGELLGTSGLEVAVTAGEGLGAGSRKTGDRLDAAGIAVDRGLSLFGPDVGNETAHVLATPGCPVPEGLCV